MCGVRGEGKESPAVGPGTVFTCHTEEEALLRVILEHLLAGIRKKGAYSKVRVSSGMAGHPEASLSYPLG